MRISFVSNQRSEHLVMVEPAGINPYLFYGLFACAVLVYYGLYFNYGIDLDDEGLLIGGAAAINSGKFPLADFYSYQPWMYFALAGFFRLLGTTLLTERFFLIVNLVISSLCVLWLARQVLPPWPSLIPALLYAAAPGPWYKVFFIFHLLLVLAALFLFNDRPRPRYALLAGLAAGFALVSRDEVAAIALLLFLGTIGLVAISELRSEFDTWRATLLAQMANIGAYVIGCLTPLAMFATVYLVAGKLGSLIDHLRYYATPDPYKHVIDLTGRADIFSPISLVTHPQLEQWVYGISLVACLSLILVNLANFFRYDPKGSRDSRRKLILGAAAVGSMGYTFFFVWNSRMLSSFAIVYVAEVTLLFQIGSALNSYRYQILATGSILLALVVYRFCGVNFYSGSLTMRVLTPGYSDIPFLKGAVIDASQVKSIDMLRKIADSHPGAYLVPMSETTTMGFLSGLRNPTYYRLFTVELFGRKREEKAISTFEHFKIKYFVARSGQFIPNGASASDLAAYAPLVKKYLVSHYDIQKLGHNYVLLVRRGSDKAIAHLKGSGS